MKDQRIADSETCEISFRNRLTTFIIPTGDDLIVGAIAASRFYSLRLPGDVECCEVTTLGTRALPTNESVEA